MMNKRKVLADYYYQKPIFYDLLIVVFVLGCLITLEAYSSFVLPKKDSSLDFASDIGAIGLTISGFVLTMVTILISFKSSHILSESNQSKDTPFSIFLKSNLYSKSIKILKNAVFALIIVSFTIYVAKLMIDEEYQKYIFYFNVTGLIVILTTFLRCFYILGLIMKMQLK